MTNTEIFEFFRREWNLRVALDRDWIRKGRKRIVVDRDPIADAFDIKARRILAELRKNEVRVRGFILRLEWDEYSPLEGTLVFDYEPPDSRQLELDFRRPRLVRRES